MTAVVLADNAYGTIASALTATDSAMAFTPGHGARFPAVVSTGAGAAPLYACLVNSGNVLEEIKISVHGTGSDTATIVRGIGGTTPKAWNAGDRIEARISSTALNALAKDYVSVTDPAWGAVGDGVTDCTAAIQAAINAMNAAGGGAVYLPGPATYACVGLTLKEGVFLIGMPGVHGSLASYSSVPQVKLLANGVGTIVDTPVAATGPCGVIGINFGGLGAGTACKGVHFRSINSGYVKHCDFNNFSDEGLLVDSGSIACTFDDILATNCVLNRARAAKIGAVDIDGSDHFVSRIEATISGSNEGTVQSSNLYCVGVMVRCSTAFFHQVVGEISDVGIEVAGNYNRLSECRADLNYGHGWNVTGGANQIVAPLGLNNSQDTTNTYDNFRLSLASANNVTLGAIALDTLTKKAKYGFNDLVQSAANKNKHISPFSNTAVTANFLNDASNGSAFEFSSGALISFSANATAPSVDGSNHFLTANSNPTTITDFTGGVSGQHIYVLVGDSNTTFQHNGVTITLPGGVSISGTIQQIYHFIKTGAVWRRVN